MSTGRLHGAILAARHSFMPNRLGYCGPDENDVLFDALVNNKPTKEANDLTAMVTKTNPGTKVNLKVWRDRKELAIPVTIEKQPRGR